MKRNVYTSLKGLLSMLAVSACSLTMWADAPQVIYTFIKDGGQLSPKQYSQRVDFDTQISSVKWAYVQNGAQVASGTLTGSEQTGNYQMVNVPVSSALSTLLSSGSVEYGPITLQLSNMKLLDGSAADFAAEYQYTLTADPTVTMIYPDNAYPGNDLQEFSSSTVFTVTCSTGTKAVSGVVEVWQSGAKLGTFTLKPYSDKYVSNSLKNNTLGSTIETLGVQPGVVSLRVVEITYLDDADAQQTNTSECFAEVNLMHKGKVGQVVSSKGLIGGVQAWFDPNDSNGLFTLTFDQEMAEGAVAELEYGTERQNFIVDPKAVMLSEDKCSVIVDLRGMLLTKDAITGEHDYVFYDEQGGEMEPPTKILLNIDNLKTAIGTPVAILHKNENIERILNKFSQSFAYSDNPATLGATKSVEEGKTVLVKMDGAKVTFEMEGKAFVEDTTGAVAVEVPAGMLSEGKISGIMVLKALGDDNFEVFEDVYDLTSRTREEVCGTVIGRGSFFDHINRLVTFNANNTTSMGFNSDLGIYVIDDEVLVIDLFGVLGDFDWNRTLSSVTGLLLRNTIMPASTERKGSINAILVPRSVKDIEVSVPVGIEEIEVAAKSGKVYNLQGVRVDNPQKGLYILDGKKVIIK